MNKNLLEQLKDLTQRLVEAEHDGDEELIESLEDEIFELEFEIEEESLDDYSDNHYKTWN